MTNAKRLLALFFCPMILGSFVVADDVIYLDQGLTDDERQQYYYDPQGSELLPYEWLPALEQPYSNKLVLNNDYIRSFGYLPNEKNKHNPNGLPVGFALSDREERAWVGMTCAACHTGQISYEGKSVRIDGGSGLPDIMKFQSALTDSLRQTLNRKAKFSRFVTSVLGENATDEDTERLRNDMAQLLDRFEDWGARNRPAHPGGFGRWDAMHVAFNDVAAVALSTPENFRVPVAPASYPCIWLTRELDNVLWNGSVHSIISRGIGESVIVFGRLKLQPDLTFESSVSIPELDNMYTALKDLQPPKWPENVLGKIDQEKAARGAKLYVDQGCVKCHANKPPYPMTEPNQYGERFIRTTNTPLEEIGTDPTYAVEFLKRTADKSIAAPLFKGTMFEKSESMPVAILFLKGLAVFTEYKFAEMKASKAEVLEYSGNRPPVQVPTTPDAVDATMKALTAYKTQPLAGVWSTAPYLHNGSVKSLYELLLPPEKRARAFYVGNREFDPVHVGYQSESKPGLFRFDTTVTGNGNSGHEYGTKLSDSERWDLIEYLKTL